MKRYYFILVFQLFIFTSCSMFMEPVKEYFDKCTGSASVIDCDFSGEWPVDRNGALCLPYTAGNSEGLTVTYRLNNPLDYELDSIIRFAEETQMIIDSESRNLFSCVVSNEGKSIKLFLSKALMKKLEKGKTVNPELSLVEKETGRVFPGKKISFKVNSEPPAITNFVPMLIKRSADSEREEYVFCFDLPSRDLVCRDSIHEDISTIILNDSNHNHIVYSTDNKKMLVDSDGTISIEDDSPVDGCYISTKNEFSLLSDDSMSGKIFESQSGQCAYLFTGVEKGLSDYSATITIIDKDGLYSLTKMVCNGVVEKIETTNKKTVENGDVPKNDEAETEKVPGDDTTESGEIPYEGSFIIYAMGKNSTCNEFKDSSFYDELGTEVCNGSVEHPYKSIQDALNAIQKYNESLCETKEFTLFCDGVFEPVNDEKYCGKVAHVTRKAAEIGSGNPNGFKKLKVSIIGLVSSKAVFDGKNTSGKDSPVLDVDSLSEVYLKNIKITGGNTTGYGAGIVNRGKLTLENCEVSENSAFDSEGQNNGGAIYHVGMELVLKNSEIKNNTCKNFGSAVFCQGDSAVLKIDGSIFESNTSGSSDSLIYTYSSIELNGNVEIGTSECIMFYKKINITAGSKLEKISNLNVLLSTNEFNEGEQVLFGNIEDNYEKIKLTDTTWCVNSAGELSSGRVLLSTIGLKAPRSGYFWISEAADFDKIRDWVAGTEDGLAGVDFTLLNDIDLKDAVFIPIGISTKPFRGKLDGNNKTINGISITENIGALFNYTGNGCEIRNLTVMGKATAAGIVHHATNTLIENCTNKVVVNSTSGSAIGGIASYITRSTVRNCVNQGDVKTNYYPVGGVIGSADQNSEIDRIANYGIVYTSKDDTNSYAGGLVGSLSCNLKNSCNYGSVSGQTYAGGIAGFIYAYSNKGIKNCYNAGSVTCSSSGAGIVAQLHHDGVSNYEITNCYNIGQIVYSSGKQILTYVHTNSVSKTGVIVKNNYCVSGMKYNGYAIGGVNTTAVNSYPEIEQALDYDKDTMIVKSKSKSLVDLLNEWVDSNKAGESTYSRWVESTNGTSKIYKFDWE